MKGGEHRRSSRISALEEKARLLALQKKTKGQGSSSISNVSSTAAKRKVHKRKSLQEVVVKSATVSTHFQEDETLKDEDTSKNADQPENDLSSQRMPKKQTLEFILDILQRRDTEELFAQPVDSNELEGYYNVVKEPMDFGTMRAKLQEGMYTSLEQFERDVFLISSNAMKFNSSTTLFYKEARSISELAQRLFHSLKTEPENFDLEYSRTRRRPGKQSQEEAGGSNAELCKPGRGNGVRNTSVKRNTSRYLTWSCLNRNISHTYTRGRSSKKQTDLQLISCSKCLRTIAGLSYSSVIKFKERLKLYDAKIFELFCRRYMAKFLSTHRWKFKSVGLNKVDKSANFVADCPAKTRVLIELHPS